jgi:hypothetical protein
MTAKTILGTSLRSTFTLVAILPRLLDAATVIVGDGGSISAAVLSANSGDTIEIQSNQFFNETLSWENKYLTVRAANGFAPGVLRVSNIRGTNPITGGTFSGLSINEAFFGGTGTRFSDLTFRQCVFATNVSIGGTGDYSITALFEDNQFNSGLIASGTGDALYDVTLRDNISFGDVNFVGNAGPHPVLLEDNHITGQLTFATSISDTINATALRNEIHGSVIFAVGTFSNSQLTAKNNLIVPPNGGTEESGFDVRALGGDFASTTTLNLTNNSIIGFNHGLTTTNLTSGTFNAQIQNMLLYNNDDIIGFTASQIGNSLISDGTFAGQNGNIGAIPYITSDYRLILESPGIDAGSNSAAAGLLTDLRGNPRIIDGNQDGVVRVDVGAIESPIPEPVTIALAAIASAIFLNLRRICLGRSKHGR